MSYGLTAEGFVRKRLDVIQAELNTAFVAAFGADVVVDGESVFGELIGILSEREALVWELGESVCGSAYPDSAEGVHLDNAVAITGHARLGALYSTVTLTCSASGGSPVTLPIGRQVKNATTGAIFETTEAAVIPAGGSVDVAARAVNTGAVAGPAGTLETIVTPVTGWTSVTNAEDAVAGRSPETDAALRIRRRQNLVIAKAGGIGAVEAQLRLLPGVVFAGVTENRTHNTVGGLPPHSIKAVVRGGDDQDIADTLWATKADGIETSGTTPGTVTDSFGNLQTLYWSRPTPVSIYMSLDMVTSSVYPVSGDALVKDAAVAYVATLGNGDDPTPFGVSAALAGIPGIVSMTLYLGSSAGPTVPNTPVAIDLSSIAVSDVSQVTVS